MTIGINDYPWASAACGANNPANCSYSIRNCTDFAMWRIRHDLGVGCLFLGNAKEWGIKAAGAGYRVDGNPALGSILQLDGGVNGASSDGHVAFVLGVGPGSFYGLSAGAGQVVCEQYNWNPCAYSKRVFPVAGSHFIHIHDLSGPPPPPPPPTPTGFMEFIFSPAGLLLIVAGAGVVLAGEVRKDRELRGPSGRRGGQAQCHAARWRPGRVHAMMQPMDDAAREEQERTLQRLKFGLHELEHGVGSVVPEPISSMLGALARWRIGLLEEQLNEQALTDRIIDVQSRVVDE